ncbi:hypothetical protein ACFL34_03585 [Candidatus Sumerlaeota bacterium]
MDKRLELAEKIIELFKALPEVVEVFPRGTLATRKLDEFSDIDIGIDVSGHDNAAFAKTVAGHMAAAFDFHFCDWATSLMPGSYVQTFFLKGLPLFWNVDFEITATPHYPTLTRDAVERDPVAGFLKVWPLNTKYVLRETPNIDEQIKEYYRRVFGQAPSEPCRPERLLKNILDELRRRGGGQFSEFLNSCDEVYEQYLSKR